MGNNESSGGGGGGGGGGGDYGGSHPGYSGGSSGYGVPSSGGNAWSSNTEPIVSTTPQLIPCSGTFELPEYSGTSKLSGEKCTMHETLRADSVMNATSDTSVGPGSQISGMIMSLQGDINYSCASENLEDEKK